MSHLSWQGGSGTRAIDFKRTVSDWLDRFYRLLDLHRIQPAGGDNVWLVSMKCVDGKAHVLGAQGYSGHWALVLEPGHVGTTPLSADR